MRNSFKRHRTALVALAFVATGIGGYGAASATAGDPPSIDVSPNTGQLRTGASGRAAPTVGKSEIYHGITPCRIIDTREAGGSIATTSRDFKATGDLAPQGGAGNCGIPDYASSIAVNLTGISKGGTGFMRALAFGSGAAGATVLNYGPGLNATNQATVPLCRKPATGANPCTAGKAFTVRNAGNADLVADAIGYYAPPIYAYVAGTGVLGQSSGVKSVVRTASKPVGNYEITFDRDVTDCAASATDVIADTDNDVSIEIGIPAANKAKVGITRADNQFRDSYFYLTVTC